MIKIPRHMAALFIFLCHPLPVFAGAVAPIPVSIPPPPVAPVHAVTNNYFGTVLTDPYQWMENLDAPEVKAWFKGQADYTNAVLARIPGRAPLLSRIQALDSAGISVSDVQRAGGMTFYEKTTPESENRKLYVRDGVQGAERLLLDPEALTTNGVHYSLDTFAPSWDGKYVAYALSAGGSEKSTIRVLETATGKVLPDTIDRATFPTISWNADGRSFFYRRFPILPPNAPPSEEETQGRVYLHTLGNDPDQETPVFGYGVSKDIPATLADDFIVVATQDSPYLFAAVEHGVTPEISLYGVLRTALNGAQTPWKRIADVDAAVTDFGAHGDKIYLMTHKEASRYKVICTSIPYAMGQIQMFRDPAMTVVPPSAQVVEDITPAQDALYVRTLDGGIGRVLRVPYGSGKAQKVTLPYDGSVDLTADPHLPGTLLTLTSWTKSSLWYAYNPKTGQVTDTGLKPLSPVDFSGVTSMEVKAKAADGTLIPLSIVYSKTMKQDGTRPTLLEAYGAYGYPLDPYFDPTALAWLERGGILAYAHVRGGGEYGEDWHKAGQKLNKPNSWHDFDACAQYLIDHKYTSSARLAGMGTSAGGDMINPAYVERPNLLAAAISNVGDTDAVRFELMPGGPSNIPEFGTSTTPEGFKALYAMDAYQHVRNGVKYPAVLLTTGINDPRVSPWEPAKMTARLQAAAGGVPGAHPALLRVDYDAGHAGIDATKTQRDALEADIMSFLLWQFGDPQFQPRP